MPIIDDALPVYRGGHCASVSGFVTGRAETNRVNEATYSKAFTMRHLALADFVLFNPAWWG